MTVAESGERVILLHGLWLGGYALAWLARRLRRQGFVTEIHSYPSLRERPEAAADRLRKRLMANPQQTTHLIGHSLGGMIATLASAGQSIPGRTLCLGSPLKGSAVAARVATVVPGWLGQSRGLLLEGVADWTGPRALGMIAGDRGIGLGRLALAIAPPHDGTVAVTETRLPGLAAHLQLPLSHSGLIFSDRVAIAAERFLRLGRFE